MAWRWISCLRAFLHARRVMVQGWSMAPTLLPGDYLLIDTLAYRLRAPQRGEVVLVQDPDVPQRLLVKRVLALPGDTVEEDTDGLVRVTVEGNPSITTAGRHIWKLGEGEYFLVGDGEAFSRDSRAFGPVRLEAIVGRVWLVYWPPSRWKRLA